jgi:CheY-like chemotaxis protein
MRFTEAEDGAQALEAIAKQRPDLILVDIQLPIIDGYTAQNKGRSYFAIHPDYRGHVLCVQC